jgi:hypothetical protein
MQSTLGSSKTNSRWLGLPNRPQWGYYDPLARRVLTPSARQCARISDALCRFRLSFSLVFFVPGANRYDPTTSDGESLDEFHLFHFDKPWFLELITERFGII